MKPTIAFRHVNILLSPQLSVQRSVPELSLFYAHPADKVPPTVEEEASGKKNER